jgi:hypothetical protein
VYPFQRKRDEDGDEPQVPADDAGDFGVSEAQQRRRELERISRENRETYKKMEQVWNEIQERLRNPWRQ